MAGDWIKMTCGLRDEPEVIGIAEALGINEDEVVGKLHRFWSWADQKTRNGNAPIVTASWVDRYIGVAGFAEAMENVGWLFVGELGIIVPNFDRHMGQSAKSRALTSKRVAKYREKTCNDNVTHEPLPEKRREEVKKKVKKSVATKTEIPIPETLQTPEFVEAWKTWHQHRREINKPLKPTSKKQQLAKMCGWGPERAVNALENSITNGWAGIFEPNQPSHTTQPADKPSPRMLTPFDDLPEEEREAARKKDYQKYLKKLEDKKERNAK